MFSSLFWAIGLLSVLVHGQVASQWYDSLTGVTWQRYYQQDFDASWGYLFPSSAGGAATDEFIGIFQAPANSGWIGNSLGGGMRNAPLIVGWVDGTTPRISARWATDYAPPSIYSGPRLTILGSSGSNGQIQRIVYRCQNCTSWSGGGIPSTGSSVLGWAFHATLQPLTPSDPNSGLYRHSAAGQHGFDLGTRTSSYNYFLQQLTNAPPLSGGAPTQPPTSQPPTPTTPPPQPPPSSTFVSCPGAPNPRYPINVVSGWRAVPVLGSLSEPRGITMDTRGNLLVLQRGRGLSGHTLDANGCVTSSKMVIQDSAINHGVDVHPAGNRIIASSGDIAWSWDYDPVTMTTSNKRTLVTGMNNNFHFTRTILISKKNPNIFAINVGSASNIDEPTRQPGSGRAQIRVFDYNNLPASGTTFTSSYGRVLGYGLRNDVGIAQDRAGNFWSIENSLDDAYRMINGQRRDIHINNPAEKVYNLGDPANPRSLFGGYPDCYTIWEPADFNDSTKRVGDWFTQTNSGQYNDAYCNSNTTAKPVVLLPPHTAPLDFKFGVGNDSNLYVPLHGSWNRQPPQGYKVVIVPGRWSASGEWSPTVSLAETKNSWSTLISNVDETRCSGFGNANCFRPVGLVFSPDGQNLYVTSDSSGEVILVKRLSGPTNPGQPPTITTQPGTPTSQPPVQPPTTIAPPQATQTMYGQCGGQGWTGPTLCPANAVCRASNQWYSQCVPA
ncbi:hypothetical protein CC1G_09524 [Coprinopsis cinerea okayama7|uniref:CBM1 domain-containing protein n=1 Tax=Coprinopsis cinerea (strain Okayama-7 / 130 / ATCC MYA-4618 / FGSC 9003) TaxID=240176 RepID=A8P0V3_COPC7|nr:hypothetical protein CC1G_09524 [Coprinopsis cinerea okayama7\|eukprot:XP_001837973.1 hypothetical protein CC1G_09524 [Coprinopsis cinerea okayama7\